MRPKLTPVPRTKAEALARLARLEREVRRLTGQLENAARRADAAVQERARLLDETLQRDALLRGALERQAATADVLRIIAESPAELASVLDGIAASAVRLCEASDAVIERLEGDHFYNAAHAGAQMKGLVGLPLPLTRQFPGGRAVLDRRPVIIDDIELVAETEYPDTLDLLRLNTIHSVAEIPLLSRGRPLGSLAVLRADVRPFTAAEIALLETFADQAVIAIENARLFTELEARSRDLAEALDRQTATANILRVISQALTDPQPVFEAIADSAMQLFGAWTVAVGRYDAGLVSMVAARGGSPGSVAVARGRLEARHPPVFPPERTVLTKQVHNVLDVETDRSCDSEFRRYAAERGFRSVVGVPMLRGADPVGYIVVGRARPGGFAPAEIALLQTFADQAVIAVENARLLGELQTRNAALSQALEQQTATAEILRVISSSPSELTAVYDVILERITRLCQADIAALFLYDGEVLSAAASRGTTPRFAEHLSRSRPRPSRETTTRLAALEHRAVQVADLLNDPQFAPRPLDLYRDENARTVLSVPMLREERLIGVLTTWRREVRPFAEEQVALLRTFADQAVIAVENTRLFRELEARNKDLTEALEQQTATSEILGVIAESHADTQPVFDAIIRSAVRLCAGTYGSMVRLDGDTMHLWAHHNYTPEALALVRERYPAPVTETSLVGLAVRQRALVHSPDTAADPRFRRTAYTDALGIRAQVSVPLLRDGQPIGTLNVLRSTPGAFTDRQLRLLETFADQAVIAVENVRLFKELEARNADLTGALDRETATGEILQVISSSPTDAQPAFAAIADSAARLTGAVVATLYEYDGQLVHLRALSPPTYAHADQFRQLFPRPLAPDFAAGRVILGRTVLHVADLLTDPATPPASRQWAEWLEIRGVLWVPLLRDGEPIGVIGAVRAEVGRFSDDQVKLLETFADQAVIAIENVRLFKELEARNADLTRSLDRQTATAEILRVISRSRTDVQPVFDAIADSATRLLGGWSTVVLRFDGDLLHAVAVRSGLPGSDVAVRDQFPIAATRGTFVGDAILDREVKQIEDVEGSEYEWPALRAIARTRGWRANLAVPMMRGGEPLGLICVSRVDPGPFLAHEVELLLTFADQAVIAIENARILGELEARNRDLTEALEQQTATSEVLKVISRSTFDLLPVLETLVENAVRLCGASTGIIFRFDGDVFRWWADYGSSVAVREFQQRNPVPAGRGTAIGRAALERRTVHIVDVLADPEFERTERQRVGGFRTLLAVPMMREGVLLGVFSLQRQVVQPFTDKQIELVTTFADQAVIAIENARLLGELRDRTAELTRSVGQLTALGEVGRAVSSSLDLETVLTTIVARAVELTGVDGGVVYEYEEAAEEFEQRASTGQEAFAEARRRARIRKGEGVLGRTAVTHEPVQVTDITRAGAYESRLRESLVESGVRALLAVPMLREGNLMGGLVVSRNTPGHFPPETVELLRTFATQSALAIQNARLFRQLEVANRHKSAFLASMSHELRTPLNAIIGYSEMLQEEAGDLGQDAFIPDLVKINAAGKHLLELINTVLDLSKIEAGKMDLYLEDFDVARLIMDIVAVVEPLAERKGNRLDVSCDPAAGAMRADLTKVRQVLFNLLSNACKFTEHGTVTLGVTRPRAEADDRLVFEVRDTGIGMTPEQMGRLFQEFSQADASVARRFGGTGLGLALSRRLASMMGGDITVQSEFGRGSSFTLWLPARVPEAPVSAPDAPAHPTGAAAGSDARDGG
jgi:GAF domain-containing protein